MNMHEPGSGKLIRQLLDDALRTDLDGWLRGHGFSRRAGSLIFSRRLPTAEQKLELTLQLHPSDNREASAAVYPHVVVDMPSVTSKVVEMIGGEHTLQGYCGSLRQPLGWLSEGNGTGRWHLYEEPSVFSFVSELRDFLGAYGLPFFDNYRTQQDVVSAYQRGDKRIPITDNQLLRVGAAMPLSGQADDARQALQERFGKPGRKAQFAAVLASVGIQS